ncbi:Trypanosomal VSG domain/Trypanosome variant surface glycoprotein C-terminal domain containing protein, putative [Trypanosoma equiperdum]|uniref:Trypanosomal VSG domain/Trypanosome variant surface glycoprotein C-terminal domain containing protein, putative n=1 Tax=Trypanosoma equiperdum TaxID=5694 RepID=A0A1G4I816_TRYEQ|nr:Trypanosomal VSG domain/Trypanosome variant surface glycoprotein C-terminal domain containing protein, putative [Trypanosoma equiperdum]
MIAHIALVTHALILMRPAAANIAANENNAAYRELCALIRLAKGGIRDDRGSVDLNGMRSKLNKLNMTVSPPNWQKMFFIGPTATDWAETPDKANVTDPPWVTSWPAWLEAAKAVKEPSKDNYLKDSVETKLTDWQKEQVRPAINAYAAAALNGGADADVLTDDDESVQPAKLQTLLRTISFGSDVDGETGITQATAFGDAATGNRADHCKSDNGAAKPTTAAAALGCICEKHNAGNEDDVCRRGLTFTSSWASASSKMPDNDLQALVDSCGPGSPSDPDGSELQSIVDNLRKLVHIKGSDGYLGSLKQNTDCDGNKANGICVKLTNYATQQTTTEQTVKWLGELQSAATKLKARKAKLRKQTATMQRLQEAETLMLAALVSAKTLEQPTQTKAVMKETGETTQGTPTTDSTDKKQTAAPSEFDKACEIINAADKCKDPCNWKDDKCKLKEGAAPTGSICAIYNDPETCVKAPGTKKEGKKAVCGWIKGRFQDSIFLENKQFTMGMAATSISLV